MLPTPRNVYPACKSDGRAIALSTKDVEIDPATFPTRKLAPLLHFLTLELTHLQSCAEFPVRAAR